MQAEGKSPLEDLHKVKSVIKNSKVAVAGGIKPDTIKDIVAEGPDLVIVGGGIANADDPVATLEFLITDLTLCKSSKGDLPSACKS